MTAGRVLTIVDLMRGRFARFFPAATWRAWIVVAAVLFGLAYGLTAEDQALACTLLGRKVLPNAPAREGYFVIGRRGGKSLFAAWLLTYVAFFVDHRRVLAPGEWGTVMAIAPDRRQARTIFRYVEGFIDADPMLARLVTRRTRETIELSTRVVLEVHTASFRAVRGYTVLAAVVDEAAFLPTDDSATPDAELLNALRPAMATVPGALLLVISSPYARRGELYRAHVDHFGKDGDPIVVVQAASRVMNPTIDEAVIDRAYADDETSARAEYGACFRTDVEAFVSREAIEAATVPGRYELPPISTVAYRAFMDPAGGSGADSMTLAIGHAEGDRILIDCLREAKPPFSPEATIDAFVETLRTYRVTRVTSDRWGGEWVREPLRKRGIDHTLADKVKSDLYLSLLPALNSGRLELPDLPRLRVQLAGLERRTARGGRDTIDHGPGGGHDDVINVIAGVTAMLMKPAIEWKWLGSDDPIDSRSVDEIRAESERDDEQRKRDSAADLLEKDGRRAVIFPATEGSDEYASVG